MRGVWGAGVWTKLVDFVFPSVCPGCERRTDGTGFCPHCREIIHARRRASCPGCGRPMRSGDDHRCQACIEKPPPFAALWSCATYARGDPNGPLNRAIARLKYDHDLTFAPPLAQIMVDRLAPVCEHDAIIPVPLHRDRLRWRGFNQAVVLARPLARVCGRRLDAMALRRARATPPQVGLDENARRRNIAGAFEIRRGWDLRGQRILLVDDVYTTGATAAECARVLIAGGATRVDVAVLARAN